MSLTLGVSSVLGDSTTLFEDAAEVEATSVRLSDLCSDGVETPVPLVPSRI